MTPFEALKHAVDLLGSLAKLAEVCGVSPTAVWKWVHSSKRVPPPHVLAVSEATKIPPYILNPDIYPRALFEGPCFIGTDQRASSRPMFNGDAKPVWMGFDLARDAS